MELVGDENLERVEDWIDPAYPAKPRMHRSRSTNGVNASLELRAGRYLRYGDGEASVHDNSQHEYSRECHCLGYRLCQSSHRPEDRRHHKGGDEGLKMMERIVSQCLKRRRRLRVPRDNARKYVLPGIVVLTIRKNRKNCDGSRLRPARK